jgi:hypothetical protein
MVQLASAWVTAVFVLKLLFCGTAKTVVNQTPSMRRNAR